MRIGICDDDRLIHQEIVELCEEFFKIYGIEGNVYSYFSGEEVMKDCLERIVTLISWNKKVELETGQWNGLVGI